MFICYNIISEQLRGTITCESKPGEGVRFDISYPCVFVDGPQQGKRA
jgi:signal transduction histidine kinase